MEKEVEEEEEEKEEVAYVLVQGKPWDLVA